MIKEKLFRFSYSSTIRGGSGEACHQQKMINDDLNLTFINITL